MARAHPYSEPVFLMPQSTIEALKSLGCLLIIPAIIYGAVIFHPEGITAVVLWLTGICCVAGCFVFLSTMLDEHGEGWLLLVPGALTFCGTAFAAYVAFAITSGPNQSISLPIAVLILGLGFSLWYNIKRLGAVDGLIVTIIQLCFAVVVMGIVILLQQSNSKGQKRHQ
jgi:drug/metabolite transporter (DMT)-like permease